MYKGRYIQERGEYKNWAEEYTKERAGEARG
jgi:hypothetical protein